MNAPLEYSFKIGKCYQSLFLLKPKQTLKSETEAEVFYYVNHVNVNYSIYSQLLIVQTIKGVLVLLGGISAHRV